MNKPFRYVGIDLAWSTTNQSGFCVLKTTQEGTLAIEDIEMLDDTALVKRLRIMRLYYEVAVGVDAPLRVTNWQNNRTIETEFRKDFSPYKISMLPVNRKLLMKMFHTIKGEVLIKQLNEKSTEPFEMSTQGDYSICEVYPHATIAVCFNDNKILPYKRKKGRNVQSIKEALVKYQEFLKTILAPHALLDVDVFSLKGKALKRYEDKLDAVVCAYTRYFAQTYPKECKVYGSSDEGVFVTPIPKI